MKFLRRLLARFGGFITRRRYDERLREEIEEHIVLQAEANVRAGMSPTEARRQAVLKFGAVETVREDYHDEEGLPWIENLLRDLRIALRQLRKSLGFTLTAILTLALGIGALTTVATWTNAVLYHPWPHVADAGSMRFIDATVLGDDGYSVQYPQFVFLREQSHSFSQAAAFEIATVNLAAPGADARAVMAGTVSSNYFEFLGLKPQLGQFFQPNADNRAFGSHEEVVLSDALWRERFGADPNVVGRTVSLNRHAFTMIGVAPRNFEGIYGGLAETAWIPLSSVGELSADASPDPLLYYGLQVAVRLRPGISDASAAAELRAMARRFALTQNDPERYSHWDLNLRDAAHMQRGLFSIVGKELPVLVGASILLMVLVCINIASLLGQRAARRRHEIAIRTALGATSRRIAAQAFAEAGLLAITGALAGWGASTAMSRALFLLLPSFGYPLAFNLDTDARILAIVSAIAVAVTVVCGMSPVRQSLRASHNETLREGSTAVAGVSRRRFPQHVLLGLQLGICFVVLVSSGLLTRSAINIVSKNTGFDPGNVLTAKVSLSRSNYTEARGFAFQSGVLDKLRSAPGVASATITSHLPMGDDGSGNTQDFNIPDYVPAKDEEMSVVTDWEGPDFFHTMRIPLLAGREFTSGDRTSSPGVAVINEAMAKRHWPKGDAIGHNIVVGKRSWQIVGIVHNFTYSDPANLDSDSPLLFLPMAQRYYGYSTIIAIRSRSTASAVAPELREAVRSIDSALPLENVLSLKEVDSWRYEMAILPAKLLAVYALSSLLVAMLGLYAVMAYSVIGRHREFALRMALGSTRGAIFRLVLGGNAVTAAFGLITGALASITALRALRAMLFGVTMFDPFSFFTAAFLLSLTVFLSGLSPARRAASIQPMQALRNE